MATVASLGRAHTTTAGNKTVTATPTVGDLIVIVTASTGVATSSVTDNQSGTYTQVGTTRTGFSTTGNLQMWVRTARVTSAVSTVYTATQSGSTGGGLQVLRVTGMSLAGSTALASSGGQSTGTSGTTPAPVLGRTPNTNNPIITAVANGTNSSTTVVPRTGYTEVGDSGHGTPSTGFEVAYRASGETSATLTHGGTSASAFASYAIELFADVTTDVTKSASYVVAATPTITKTAQYCVPATKDHLPNNTTIDSYSEANSIVEQIVRGNGGIPGWGQSFTGNGSTLAKSKFYIKKVGSPTGKVFSRVYSHSGTYGTSSIGSTLLAESQPQDVSTLSTSLSLVSFDFVGPNAITLTNAVNYVVLVLYLDGDGSNHIISGDDNTSPSHSGNRVALDSGFGWLTSNVEDVPFYVQSGSAISAQYTVITTPADITKTADYDVARSTDITKSAQYAVIRTVDYVSAINTYYFDGSDAGATDPNGSWTNDANAFDGSTSTYSQGTSNNNPASYLKAEGTNSPLSGNNISTVRVRSYGGNAAWSSYSTLSTPAGGWTWQKVNDLEVRIYSTATDSGSFASAVYTNGEAELLVTHMNVVAGSPFMRVYRVELEVTSTSLLAQYAVASTPKLETLVDDFGDNSLDSSLWTSFASGGSTVIEQNQQIELAHVSGGGTPYGAEIRTIGAPTEFYDLEDSYLAVQLVQAPNQSVTTAFSYIEVDTITGADYISISVGNGLIECFDSINNSLGTVSYDPYIHNLFRIRETSGTLYFEYSTDGTSWSTLFSESTPAFSEPITKVTTILGMYGDPGESSPGTTIFDNVNSPVSITNYNVTKTAEYVVALASVDYDITKSASYLVSTTPADKTFTASYVVISSTDISKTAQYTVPFDYTTTKSAQYTVTKNYDITKSAQYLIARDTDITKLTQYAVTFSTDIQKSASYVVISSQDISKTATYAVPFNYTLTKTAQYTVPKDYEISKSAQYHVATSVDLTKTADYDVTFNTDISSGAIYVVVSSQDLTKTSQYTVTANFDTQKTAQYSVPSDLTINKTADYDVATSTTTPVSVTYQVLSTVDTTKSASYVVISSQDISKTASYAVPFEYTVTKTAQYAVTTDVTVDKTADYDVAVETTVTKSADYDVVFTTDTTRPAAYVVISSQDISKVAAYTVPFSYDLTKTAQYSVATDIVIQKVAQYLISRDIDITKTGQYVITFNTDIQKTASYVVVSSQDISKVAQYQVPSTFDITKSASYTVVTESLVTKTAQYTVPHEYDIAKPSAYETTSAGDVLIAAEYVVSFDYTINQSAQYAVIRDITLTRTADYDVSASTDITKVAQYTITSDTTIQKDIAYEVAIGSDVAKQAQYTVESPFTIAIQSEYSIDGITMVVVNAEYSVAFDSTISKTAGYVVLSPFKITSKHVNILGVWGAYPVKVRQNGVWVEKPIYYYDSTP